MHRRRLYDAFYRRQSTVFQIVATLATALIRHENQESVVRQMRKLGELLFPEDEKKREEQEEAMKDVLRHESKKSYNVRKVNLDQRGE